MAQFVEVDRGAAEVVEAVEANEADQEAIALFPEEVTPVNPTVSGISLGTCILGIHIRLHWSMFLILFFALLTPLARHDPWIMLIFNFVLFGPVLFITVFMHEIGHVLVTLKQGGEVTDIVLWPGGGLTVTVSNDGNLWNDFIAAIVGPLMHIPMIIVWTLLTVICERTTDLDRLDSITDFSVFLINLAYYAIILNVIILLANIIIPVYPFGARRIFGDLLMITGMSVSKAAKITASLGIIVGVAHVVLAFFFASAYYIFIAIWLAVLIVVKSLSLCSKANGGRLNDDVIFGRLYCDDPRNTNGRADNFDNYATDMIDTVVEMTGGGDVDPYTVEITEMV